MPESNPLLLTLLLSLLSLTSCSHGPGPVAPPPEPTAIVREQARPPCRLPTAPGQPPRLTGRADGEHVVIPVEQITALNLWLSAEYEWRTAWEACQ